MLQAILITGFFIFCVPVLFILLAVFFSKQSCIEHRLADYENQFDNDRKYLNQ